MRVRSNRNVITLELYQFFLSKCNFSVHVRVRSTRALQVISVVTGSNYLSFLYVLYNVSRGFSRSISMRGIIARRRNTNVLSSGFLSRWGYLYGSIQKQLRFMKRVGPRLVSVPRGYFGSQNVFPHKGGWGVTSTYRRRYERQVVGRQFIVC